MSIHRRLFGSGGFVYQLLNDRKNRHHFSHIRFAPVFNQPPLACPTDPDNIFRAQIYTYPDRQSR